MKFKIDPDNGAPIFEQLIRQIKFAIAEGVLVPGELIPSTRELSRQLAINPNTVQRAFSQLQADEIIEAHRGRGVAVCQGARRHCISERQNLVAERFSAAIDEALHSGLDVQQLRDLFEKQLKKSSRDEGK
ncbi:MAG: GntR family transcriptional regulator [Pirellulaceae bacterium]